MILYLVPTRGRPQNAERLARSFQQTCRGETFLKFCVDEDDERLDDYVERLERLSYDPLFDFLSWSVGPRRRLGPTLNHYALEHVTTFDILGFMGDDHLPQTPGWDVMLSQPLRSTGLGISYGNDLVQRENLPTAVMLTSNIVSCLGYMAPPQLMHMYLDNFWRDLGRNTDTLTYVPDAVVQHVHPVAGTAQWDETYTTAGALMDPDGDRYHEYLRAQFADDVYKISRLRESLERNT